MVALAQVPEGTLGATLEAEIYPPTSQEQLIQLDDQIHGSNIWNAAWRNRPLIQMHAFWEV
jgi:hypothetical protein